MNLLCVYSRNKTTKNHHKIRTLYGVLSAPAPAPAPAPSHVGAKLPPTLELPSRDEKLRKETREKSEKLRKGYGRMLALALRIDCNAILTTILPYLRSIGLSDPTVGASRQARRSVPYHAPRTPHTTAHSCRVQNTFCHVGKTQPVNRRRHDRPQAGVPSAPPTSRFRGNDAVGSTAATTSGTRYSARGHEARTTHPLFTTLACRNAYTSWIVSCL